MHNSSCYRLVKHLDEPQRFLSFTLDEAGIALLGLILLVSATHKLLLGLFCFGLYSGLKYLKQNQGPRYLLILIYWYAPKEIGQMLVKNLPASYLRVWVG